MRAFESVRYQDQAARLVESALESGRLAHAYVFSGPQGVGRLTAALGLAASLVCERQAGSGYCGGCRQCERVFRFDHPDVRVTVPVTGSTTEEQLLELFQRRATDGISPLEISGKGYIGIAQVRAISQRLSRRAFENRGRVEIISGAESMRVEAANALLKTLEEPPPGVHLILTTSSFSSLLPTVRSRSQLVRFRRIPAAAVARELEEKLQVDPSCAMRIAAACNG
ncbi:hypothetical protein JW921_07435, partial [Candidatus Fermentibacterales bacterium]|nr:hypothetical protein [Candidatus Fermentibacterales bacterium]